MEVNRSSNQSHKQGNDSEIARILDDPDYSLWVMIQWTRRVMASAREMELRESGLSNTEASVLFITQVIEHIHRQPTPTEISRWLYRRPHSISALLNRMAKRGLLRIVTGQGGKNTKRAVLTDKGRRLYEQTSGRASIHNIMSCLAAEDREKLWSSLEKLRDAAVKEVGIKQVMPWPRPR